MRFPKPDELTYTSLLLGVFKLFGVATFSAAKTQNSNDVRFVGSRLAIVYNVVLIWAIGATNYVIVTALYNTFRASLTLFHMLVFFEMIFGSLVSLLILMFYSIRQKLSMRLTTKIYKIKSAGERLSLESSLDNNGLSSTYLCVAVLTSLYFLVTMALLGAAMADYENLIIMMSSGLREFVIIWLLVQYAVVMRVILGLFEGINGALTKLAGLPKTSDRTDVLTNARQLQMLSSVHELHSSLLQLCQEVVKFYELMIFGCIAYVVICLVVFAYVLIAILVERRSPFPLTFMERVYFVLGLLSYVSSFVVLSRYVTKTLEEIDKTGIIVHQIIRGAGNGVVLKELEDFSLYLLHTKVKFTAWGFFEIDGGLVKSIFSSITTYLVIVIQFQLSSVSKSQAYNNTSSK